MSSFGKKFITLVSLTIGISSAHAESHGVEKIVPFDAHNFKVEVVEVGGLEINRQPIASSATEGNQTEAVYGPSVAVVVSYDSEDKTDVPKSGSGANGEFTPWDITKPQFVAFLKISKEKYDAYLNGDIARPTANDIAVFNSGKEATKKAVKDEQYHCRRDSEYGYKVDPKCQEPEVQYMNVAARTVRVDFK